MADTAAPDVVADVVNTTANITFTFEEQATASCSLYAMSLLCIVLGGIRSAQFVKKEISKNRPLEGSITLSEAKKFPITASLVLFGLYLVFKPDAKEFLLTLATTYLPANILNVIAPFLKKSEGPGFIAKLLARLPDCVQPYLEYLPEMNKDLFMKFLLYMICFEGCCALAAILKPIFSFILRLLPIGDRFPRFKTPFLLSLTKGKKEIDSRDMDTANKKDIEYLIKIDLDTHDIIAILVCLSVMVSHIMKRHWITNNIIGIAFSIYGIENLHLSSFKAGSILLCGLFIYDIFWVFGTDVMTSVAKGIDAPILLQFPQDIYRNGWFDATKHSMLGLGDIVIPGIFIALLRRFDQRIGSEKKAQQGGRYYFYITIVAYALGLLITMLVMHHFKAAQPALLYLVPCCLFVPLLVATVTGELSELWNYDEYRFTEKAAKEKEEKAASKKKTN